MLSLGDYLDLLVREHPEEVVCIHEPINPTECDAAAYEELFAQQQRYPWLIFDNVTALDGSRWPGLFTTYPDTSRRRIAIGYGFDPKKTRALDITERHMKGMRQIEVPAVICRGEAPVKQRVLSGPDLTLDFLPFFRNAEKDGRPGWLTPIYIVRDFDTGRYNISWHRGQYMGPRRISAEFSPGREIHEIFQKYKAAGKPMPCAAVIGHHPAFGDAAATAMRGIDEFAGVGGVYRQATGSQLRAVPSELWGDELLVPADAEIVLEGYMLDEYADSGPWSDYWRAYVPIQPMNLFEVSLITMRENPIFESVWPVIEVHAFTEALLYERVKPFFPGVKDIHVPFSQVAIVAYRPRMPGEAFHLAGTLLSLGYRMKTIIIIDEDLDPHQADSVFFSLGSRFDAKRDVAIIPMARSVYDSSNREPTIGGLLIDLTRPDPNSPLYEISKPPQDRIEAARNVISPDDLGRVPSGTIFSL